MITKHIDHYFCVNMQHANKQVNRLQNLNIQTNLKFLTILWQKLFEMLSGGLNIELSQGSWNLRVGTCRYNHDIGVTSECINVCGES